MAGTKLKLMSSDNEIFEADQEVALQSDTVKKMVENADASSASAPIPLPEVSGKVLDKVIEYCKYHVNAKEQAVTDEEVKAWDQEFIKIDQSTLFDLIMAADHLKIKDLSELTTQAVADMVRGQTPEEIASTFGSDLSPEQMEEVRRENQWAFENPPETGFATGGGRSPPTANRGNPFARLSLWCQPGGILRRAVIALSPSLSSSQLTTARHVAATIGIPLWEVETTEGQVPEYVANEGASCYACKATLYTTLYTVAQQSLARMGMENSNMNEVTLFNGTNADDLSDPSRLGLLAALHCRVVSPLARLPKAAVRAVARAAGLPNWDLAASPCLRSRLAFGVEATASTLMLVERAEEMVRSLLPLTPRDNMRVRLLHPHSTTTTTSIPPGAIPLESTLQSPLESPQSQPIGASSALPGALSALLEVEASFLQQAEEQQAGIEAVLRLAVQQAGAQQAGMEAVHSAAGRGTAGRHRGGYDGFGAALPGLQGLQERQPGASAIASY
ncbi:unnamed protein product [Closterium sp. Yama58-4]|nr:unnamed protein product [Closterium sp. Yama58-4]